MTRAFSSLTLTEVQFRALEAHLFPGDGKESVAIVLCGHAIRDQHVRLLGREIFPIPDQACSKRTPVELVWPSELMVPQLQIARTKNLSVVKIHSHPTNIEAFSLADDVSDSNLFPSIYGWVDDSVPHASAVMLPGGRMFGRTVNEAGEFSPMSRITIVGDDIRSYSDRSDRRLTDDCILQTTRREAPLFGAEMTDDLGRFSVAVVGCSGLGSLVAELLARHGFGRIILVDPDRIERRNLGRIINAFPANIGSFKVEVAARAIKALGFGTVVETHATDLATPDAVRAVSSCDFALGCMDSLIGRAVLNRLATFYLLPYVDLGVRIDTDRAEFNRAGLRGDLLPAPGRLKPDKPGHVLL